MARIGPFAERRFTMITRRTLLRGAAGILPATLLNVAPLWAQQSPVFADVHCHVFNAHDLPVRGFVQRVVFGDEEHQVVLDEAPDVNRALIPWIGAVLVRQLLTGAAPSAEKELRDIEDGKIASAEMDSESAADALADALRSVFSSSFSQSFENLPAFERQVSGASGAFVLRRLAEEAGQGGDALFSEGLGEPDYGEMSRGLLRGDRNIPLLFRWGALLNSPRRNITAEVARLYGRDGHTNLFTPALIDFSRWLDEEPRSGLESQVRVMERIQRIDRQAVVHCFIPFDPWREVADLENGGGDTALDLVKWAINDMGFIGVKLYPPMGFRPAGNQGAGLTFPERAADIPEFTRKLDEALDRLFQWAATQGVPVMAHAADSNGAASGYSNRASPANWMPVIGKFPDLRLNLAHFGRFAQSSSTGNSADDWEVIRGNLIKNGGNNLFSDIGYFDEVLPGKSTQDELTRLRAAFTDFVSEFDPQVERLLFATDWNMLGQEPSHGKYVDAVEAFIESVGLTGPQRRRLFGGNAVRYLGLRPGEPARTRLDDYYRRSGLDSSRLDAFN